MNHHIVFLRKNYCYWKISFAVFVATWCILFIRLDGMRYSFKHIPNGTVVWYGCLYKKADWLVPSNKTKCGRCIENGTVMARRSRKYYMKYRNCTAECPQPTLCSEYKFTISGILRSECYTCEVNTFEHVVYKAKPLPTLCGKKCQKCAEKTDLASALSCHQACKGMPTFCLPVKPNQTLFFGQRVCYQSRRLHGCHYKEVDVKTLIDRYSKSCFDCAQRVGSHDSDICSHLCGNLPTWHKHIRLEQNESIFSSELQGKRVHQPKDRLIFLQCTLPPLGKILDYEIPSYIRQFLTGMEDSESGGSNEIISSSLVKTQNRSRWA